MEDPFTRFATECRLSVSAEAIYSAPYDIAEPPSEAEQTYLVTVTNDSLASEGALRLVFVVVEDPAEDADGAGGDGGAGEGSAPSVRDVLWWLAADAWSIEHASRDLHTWLGHHGFEAGSIAARRRFRLLLQQAATLRDMLGAADYGRLLDLHRAEATGESSDLSAPG